MPITELLEKNARLYPGETALVEINPSESVERPSSWREYGLIETAKASNYRREITWKQFDLMSNRFANLLLARGVRRGDSVAILLMNCIEWLPIYFGILKTGAKAVPLNFRYTAEEIKYCLELSDSTVLIYGPEFIGRIEQIIDDITFIKHMFYVGNDTPRIADNYELYCSFCSQTPPAIEIKDEDDAAIYFSSGTTGFPKAILHSHAALYASAVTEQKHHSQTKDDVFLLMPPLYHTGAKMHWFGSLISSSKAVLLRGIKPEWILRTVSDEGVTIVWLLVPWAQDILDSIESGKVDLDNFKLSQWRLMHIGAQPIPPSLIKRWKKYFPNHDYDTNYGLSESIGPGCVHLGVENTNKIGAIGIPGYGWEADIVNEQGISCKTNEVGELIVKGPGVMRCYYKNPKATDEVLKNGWLYTGDMAKKDEDGFIYLVDRKKDVIISGGENIYPVQIEDYIRKNDKVKDCAVIGLPDSRLGEIACAIIEVKEDIELSEQEIEEFCKKLPRYKRPKKFIFEKIPRNATGKIEKPALRKKYCGGSLVEAQFKN